MLWIKWLVMGLLLAGVVSLFIALTSMLKGKSSDGRTVKALGWRVGLCIAAFLLLVLSMAMGWVKPHGLDAPATTITSQQQLSGQR